MGLLDWLTDGIGSAGGGSNPMGDFTGGQAAPPLAPQMPMPPMQQTGADGPPLAPPPAPGVDPMGNGTGVNPNTAPPPPSPFPPGTDPMTAGGAPPNGPGLPPPPVPMPAPRPPGANAPPPLPPAAPPAAAPPPGPPLPLSPQDAGGIAQSYRAAGGNLAPPAAPSGATGFIGRALGLDANREASMRGSLATGLKAAGENWNKPGAAAFAGSAGSAIEGGKTATDKTTDQQSKYLNDAIKAKQAGDTGALNVARTRLALAQAKAAEAGKDTKASVMNSPEQLYLRGLSGVNQDVKVKASLANLRNIQTQFGADSKEAKAALAAHNALIDGTKKTVFATLGVSEKDAAEIGKKPGFASDNPVPAAGLTKEKFDALPPGAYFINPKDNRLLIKQPPAGASPTPQAQSPTPAAPAPVTVPAGSLADSENDD